MSFVFVATVYKREFEEMNDRWIGLYQKGDMTSLSEMYTADCRVLADNMLLKHNRSGQSDMIPTYGLMAKLNAELSEGHWGEGDWVGPLPT